MALWRKESNKKNAFYVDLFKAQRYDQKWLTKVHEDTLKNIKMYKTTHPWQKDDNVAVEKRKLGNTFFQQLNYRAAMEQYNKSLCFAKPGSENISLAYANRSACFYHMEMYDKCLIDIDLAKKANYPQRLMEKLDDRQAKCQKFINDGRLVQTHVPKLSFKPNKAIPVLANSVKVEYDDRRGRRIVATEDLNIGETIFLEPSYVGESYAEKYKTCSICLHLNENLVPCADCTVAMFCYGKCDSNDLHQYECDIKPCAIVTHLHAMNMQIPLIRSIMVAAHIFPTVDAFIDFVEKTIGSASLDIPMFSDKKSKYQAFLKMELTPVKYEFIPVVYSYYTLMLEQVNIAKMFNTLKHRRFLMHLILQHHHILDLNITHVGSGFHNPINPYDQVQATVTNQLSIMQLLFQHSCARNTVLVLDNGTTVGIVVRPIKAGEELCISISELLPDAYGQRQHYLMNEYKIRCICELCKLRSETIPKNLQLHLDPDFRFICSQENSFTRDAYIDQHVELLKGKCKTFLEKFGRKPWCKEIDTVVAAYVRMLQTRSVTTNAELYQDVSEQAKHWKYC